MTQLTRITIDPDLKAALPGVALAVLQYAGITASDTPSVFKGRVNLLAESLRTEHEGRQVTEIPDIAGWRAAFKQLGVDPSRYRPSSEALIRRILQNKPLFWVNSAVDVNNFLSIHYRLPFGIYNLDAIEGTVTFRLGKSGETYNGLNGREISCEEKPLLADDTGPFGSPIVDSERTKVTGDSTRLLHVVYLYPGYPEDQRDVVLGSTAEMFTHVNGGDTVSRQIIA